MKISAEQLRIQLQKNLAPIYWVAGDEILLVQESLATIRQAAMQAGYQERKIIQIDTHYLWESFLQETANFSLFSAKSLLELHFNDAKFSDEAKDALEKYSQQPATDKILLISTPKLDTKNQTGSWFKQLEQVATCINIWPIDNHQLPRWIEQRLRQAGLTTSSEGIQLLAERTEGNLLATHQAIEKLSLLYGARKITSEEIADAITDHNHYDIFALVDSALNGEAKRIVQILSTLKAEATEPTLILWSLTREIRNLLNMTNALTTQSIEQVLLQYRVWEKRKPLLKRALQRHSKIALQKLLQHASLIDQIIKGANIGNVWNELLELSLNLGGINALKRQSI